MTRLKLREGWEETHEYGFIAYKRKGAEDLFAYVLIDPSTNIRAYPLGEFGLYSGFWCDSLEEAHEYLLSVGSDSPWEAV